LFLQSETEQHYYYFGSSNLIGVGNLEEGKKSGEWKVYSKINPDNSSEPSFEKADPEIFEKQFNQDIPIYIINFSDDLPNGVFQENYSNGSIKKLGTLENGELVNQYREFFENGELAYTGQLKEGKKVGEWLEYYESGKINSSISYVDGLVDGEAIYYYQDGGVEMKTSYSQGERNGFYEAYFSDGEVKVKGMFKNGTPEGEWLSKGSNREIEFQGSFQGGIRSGEWLEQVDIMPEYLRKGSYDQGLKNGEWFVMNDGGEILQSERYEEGKLVSVIELKYSDKVKSQQIVKDGNGQRIFFDKDGIIKAKGKVFEGERNGKWYFYFPNTDRVVTTGRMVGSDKVGIWKFYSFEGELIDRIDYGVNHVPRDKDTTMPSASKFDPNKTNYNNGALGSAFSSFNPFNSANYVRPFLR
jgi:antitoxin component YwqK of YwqJK toxin-antitoxin module